ncbi:hypothetical protein AQJ84_26360 [Streptomyces resistomycificus]|uniref:Transposase n=1 Tax=Streptomyces resistomycificus TaxID=67356 RepID=A0A0L8KZL6_9ACTN|nr:hypothetical protein ADK37_31160 [Streptomyces resistomycificus]KUN94228.1 hypothetical protein AQJ84_26360 [Streptomyces resistomycificus]
MVGVPRQTRSMSDSANARQSSRLPGNGRPIATTRRLLASITTCRFVEYRQFLADAVTAEPAPTRTPS